MTAAAMPDCDAFGCIGLPRCDYCGQIVPGPEAAAVLIATRRVRPGDLLGALHVLQAATRTPEPTGPVGTSTLTRSGDTR